MRGFEGLGDAARLMKMGYVGTRGSKEQLRTRLIQFAIRLGHGLSRMILTTSDEFWSQIPACVPLL